MGRNLTSLPISASFQYLMQISGSAVTDGTGSLISSLDINAASATTATNATSASFATTAASATSASFATNANTANTATSATTATSASFATTASLANNATSASFATTASYALTAEQVNTGSLLTTASISDATITFTKGDASTFDITVNNVVTANTASYVAGANVDGTVASATSASYASTATSASHADNASTADSVTSASYATTASHALISENLTSGANINISSITASNATFTSASIGYLQTVTGSATIIGDAFILLNNDTPTQRYAGIQVYDSGSPQTSSLTWDGGTDDWFYEFSSSATHEFGVVMFGPEYSTKGSPTYPTNNRLVKGDGGHHLEDSTITDDGTTVSISASLNITGSGVNILNGVYSGSTINNITDVYGTASVEHIVTLTQAQYNAISASANPNTYYIIEDAPATVASASYALSASYAETATSASHAVSSDSALTATTASYVAGANVDGTVASATSASYATNASLLDGTHQTNNLVFSGSVRGDVGALSIASSTASMDCSSGNFFTLTLVSGSTTHLDATNVQPGQTVNLKLLQPSTAADSYGTLTFDSYFKFVDGTAFAPTQASGSVDVMTFISFDTLTLHGTGLKNFS